MSAKTSRPLLSPRCTVSLLGHCTLHVALHKVQLSFTSCVFGTKETSGDCSQRLGLREERLLRKAAKTTSQTKFSHGKGEAKCFHGETSFVRHESFLTARPRLDCEAVAQGRHNILFNESGRNRIHVRHPFCLLEFPSLVT